MSEILVTGGGGFLGTAIVERLLQRGDQVTVLARGDYPQLRELGAKTISGDISDAKTVLEAFRGKEVVFHVAAKAGIWGKYKDYYNINFIGTKNIVDACKQLGIKYLVYTSSPSVVFDSSNMEGIDESVPYPDYYLTHYPKTKAMAEQYVKQHTDEDLRTIILRPHLIWGPRDNHIVPRILQRAKQLRIVGNGKNLVDCVYIDNAADAHILAADHLMQNPEISGRAYFISQGDPEPLWDIINAILKAGGKPPIQKHISSKAAYFVGAILETLYTVLPLSGEPRMTRFVAKELSTSHWFDISAAKRDFQYNPQVSTAEGMQRLTEWLQQNPI